MKDPRIALVTGVGRLKGIGRAICVALAQQGIDIFFTYWNPYDKQEFPDTKDHEPAEIQKEILSYGVRCEKVELDLTQEASIAILLETVQQTLGTPSILINNATYSTQTDLSTITATALDCHYQVNVKATILLTAAFVKQCNEAHSGGRIVNLTSGQNLGPMPNEIAYAVTKSAIETFTKTIAHEIAAQKITINAVNPGPTDSGWMTEELKEMLLPRFPTGRIGTPRDAATLIAFLVSHEAEWITGQVMHSEGGFIR